MLKIKLRSQSRDGPVLVQVSTPITFAFWDVQAILEMEHMNDRYMNYLRGKDNVQVSLF